jgi:hypothetical protein
LQKSGKGEKGKGKREKGKGKREKGKGMILSLEYNIAFASIHSGDYVLFGAILMPLRLKLLTIIELRLFL